MSVLGCYLTEGMSIMHSTLSSQPWWARTSSFKTVLPRLLLTGLYKTGTRISQFYWHLRILLVSLHRANFTPDNSGFLGINKAIIKTSQSK